MAHSWYLDDEPRYEVEAVLDMRMRKGKKQYYLKWKGYESDENTWCDEASCVSLFHK